MKRILRELLYVSLPLIVALLVSFGLVFFLSWAMSGCGGPNQAYIQDDWPRFQQECEIYCAPEEAEPSRDQRPWVCGCSDFLDEDWSAPQ